MRAPNIPVTSPTNSSGLGADLCFIASMITKARFETVVRAETGPAGPLAIAFCTAVNPSVLTIAPTRPYQKSYDEK